MKRSFLVATAAGLLITLNAPAALVVDFNSSGVYVGARAADTSTLNGDTWNYSDTTHLINDASGQSGRIYGGVVTTWSVAQDYTPWVLKNPGDGFVVQNIPNNGSDTGITAVYLWNKADFLNGAGSQTLAFNAGDSISYHFDWMTGGNQNLRLVAKQAGITYISQWWTAGYSNISFDPTATQWAVLNTADYTWGSFSGVTLDDIEGAGVYYTLSRTNAQSAARLFDFQVEATVVPEPATLGLLALGGLGAMRRRGGRTV